MGVVFSGGWLFWRLLLVYPVTPETTKRLYYTMKRIRFVEEEIARRYSEGKMRCPTHLSIGQEGVAAGAGLALRKNDLAVSGHRAHAHYLGKGGNLNSMLSEIYGKADGCSKGKGGSMHLVDEAAGFMGSTAIVGGTVPVGVGLALAIKLKGQDNVSCIFHGDAVLETGVFFESVNFAVLKNLPALFICENNLYSVYTPLVERQPKGRSLCKMVSGFGLSCASYDGNDVMLVYEKISEALESIRQGKGPQFLEFATYRWLEHCGPNFDNHIGYRSEAEYESWVKVEPIKRLEALMIKKGIYSKNEMDVMSEEIMNEIEIAFKSAENAPFPNPKTAFSGLYDQSSSEVLQFPEISEN